MHERYHQPWRHIMARSDLALPSRHISISASLSLLRSRGQEEQVSHHPNAENGQHDGDDDAHGPTGWTVRFAPFESAKKLGVLQGG
jgi:hypothetical protein